jgi:hypothetical protein
MYMKSVLNDLGLKLSRDSLAQSTMKYIGRLVLIEAKISSLTISNRFWTK